MENKFYNDDFEHFIKGTADEFRMYPSRRVWNSLYNDLHPGKRWPSLAVCLLLITSVMLTGVLHRNDVSSSRMSVANIDKLEKENISRTQIAQSVQRSYQTTSSTFISNNTSAPAIKSPSLISITSKNKKQAIERQAKKKAVVNDETADINDLPILINSTATAQIDVSEGSKEEQIAEERAIDLNRKNIAPAISVDHQNSLAIGYIATSGKTVSLKSLETKPDTKADALKTEREWIEDFAFHNKPSSRKSQIKHQLYVTPSLGFRDLEGKSEKSNAANSSLIANAPEQDLDQSVNHRSAFNLEVGYARVYEKSKSLRLKTGVQLNYTNYKIGAHQLGHPSLTSLLLKNSAGEYEYNQRLSRLSNLPNFSSEHNLNSSSVQISIPVGADLKLLGKNRFRWYVGGTVQPTYLLFGNAYLLSSDLKNYVYDSKFLRKWNINTAVESFISYSTKKGLTYQAGPQFRYQLLSTYDDKYLFNEKLYNIGVKLGVTKTL